MKLLKRIDEGFFRLFCSLLFAAVAAVCLSAMFDFPFESTGFMISVIFESILFLLAAVGCLCGARRVGILLLFPLVLHILLIIAEGVLPGLHNVFFCGAYVCTIRLFLAVRKKQGVRGIPIRKHRRKTNPFRATASSSSVGISTDMPSSSSLHLPESDPFCGRRV